MAVRDKIFAAAKGFRGRAKNCIKTARDRVHKAWQYQYRDRRTKKREYRKLWITRINAATREHGVRADESCSERSIVIRDRSIQSSRAR
jgi:large subunit ribosomal protein L20